jgi:hypothetical protein
VALGSGYLLGRSDVLKACFETCEGGEAHGIVQRTGFLIPDGKDFMNTRAVHAVLHAVVWEHGGCVRY